MKITSLDIKNYKRISVFYIEPKNKVILITGKCKSGKTSVLDALEAVLDKPRKDHCPEPIHRGADRSEITLKTDNGIVAKRTFTENSDRLEVTQNGKAQKPPQEFLDEHLGRLSMNPDEFLHKSDKEQVDIFLDAIKPDIDIKELGRKRELLFSDRTTVNRLKIEAHGKLPDEVPRAVESVSTSELLKAFEKEEEREKNRAELSDVIDELIKEERENHTEIARLQQIILGLQNRNNNIGADIKKKSRDHSNMPVGDTASARKAMADAENTNNEAKAYSDYIQNKKDYDDRVNESDGLTNQINAIDQTKRDAIAKSNLPVEGLGLSEDGLTLNGLPFKQASDAEQLETSVAIAMALKPGLKFIRIRNGNMLDTAMMKNIDALAEKYNCQAMIEMVDESGEIGYALEDGKLLKEGK